MLIDPACPISTALSVAATALGAGMLLVAQTGFGPCAGPRAHARPASTATTKPSGRGAAADADASASMCHARLVRGRADMRRPGLDEPVSLLGHAGPAPASDEDHEFGPRLLQTPHEVARAGGRDRCQIDEADHRRPLRARLFHDVRGGGAGRVSTVSGRRPLLKIERRHRRRRPPVASGRAGGGGAGLTSAGAPRPRRIHGIDRHLANAAIICWRPSGSSRLA
jgi:hypothetical protein